MYFKRLIDAYLEQWAKRKDHKPMLLRGARQVGKSTAVRHLGETFDNFVEINFEKQPEYKNARLYTFLYQWFCIMTGLLNSKVSV